MDYIVPTIISASTKSTSQNNDITMDSMIDIGTDWNEKVDKDCLTLAAATVNLVFMQRMHVVQATMPKCFYPKYFNTRVIIDYTEFKIEVPSTSDSQITIESGLIDKLEEGDMVLADKRFPEIKATIDQTGKKIMLVMPPFLKKKMNLHLKKLRKLIM
ncbi:hypothetical protein PV328_004111 [Microctonus aethiopoides]|uniref:DDE Tnp4 domain-containing protein n=1 Tax=Microctonus aethiopoides TaxID=144406 RepID=A0AA39KLA0_9HYME|nr:hypothetical protein PV328_004111 [Microctonus aethiopoides]